MTVTFNDIFDAFLFVDASGGSGQDAYVCRRTGKIFFHAELSDLAEFNDELPDDIADDEKYVAIPDKQELGLGKPLALDFARECLPEDFDEVRDIFSRSGAYPKFKGLLARRRAVDRWHKFENDATNRALCEWCELHSIPLAD
jgi:hypothetical protein